MKKKSKDHLISNVKTQMSNPPASPERERWRAGQIQIFNAKTFLFGLFNLTFTLLNSASGGLSLGDLTG